MTERATLAQAVFNLVSEYVETNPDATVANVVGHACNDYFQWPDSVLPELRAVRNSASAHLLAAIALVELTLAAGWDNPDECLEVEVSNTVVGDWAHNEAYDAAQRWFGASDEARCQVAAFLAY